MISVVSPVYMAEEIVEELVVRLKAVLCELDNYEIILIDDCSADRSWEKIRDMVDVRAYCNERNMGQHATIRKGIAMAHGDWTVVIDCDLQDNPHEIPKLYAKALTGYDIVHARRINIKQSSLRRWCAVMFHKLYSVRRKIKTDPAIANFAIYRRGCFECRNCRIATLDIEHCERYAGKSSYTLWKLIKLAINFLK